MQNRYVDARIRRQAAESLGSNFVISESRETVTAEFQGSLENTYVAVAIGTKQLEDFVTRIDSQPR